MLSLVLGYTIALQPPTVQLPPDASEAEKSQRIRYEMTLVKYERLSRNLYILGGLSLGGCGIAGVALSMNYGIKRSWPILAAAGVSGAIGLGAGAGYARRAARLRRCGPLCRDVTLVAGPRWLGVAGRF